MSEGVHLNERINPVSAPVRAIVLVTALVLGLFILTVVPARAGDVTLVETGSSLLYPLLRSGPPNTRKLMPTYASLPAAPIQRSASSRQFRG